MTSTFTAQNTTELMASILTTQSYPELIVNTINFRYCMATVTNSCSILMATILTT